MIAKNVSKILCKDTEDIVMSYHCFNDIDKDILYSNIYDNLYDFLMKNDISSFFNKSITLETLNNCLIGKSRKKFEKIRYICKPNIFNFVHYSNSMIKSWFDSFHDAIWIKHATEEFAELYFDDIIIENYFIDIMKIKFHRQS